MDHRQWMRPASSGEGEILSRRWQGDAPCAVLQIAHGMAEHSARYDDFARYMVENGFAVYMNDHAGHGPSAQTKGYFAAQDGWQHAVDDLKSLTDIVAAEHPGLPIFLMGHSMGSFMARSYIIRYGEGLSGCILSGTMGHNGALRMGKALAAMAKGIRGPKKPGKLIAAIAFGGFNKRIENPKNQNAWLSTVEAVAAQYDADPHSGFLLTNGGYYDLFTGLLEVTDPGWAAKVPSALPLYLFAGAEDPVGDYGKGPQAVYDALVASGHSDVKIKLYPGGRHEMLNEANKAEVYADVLAWLDAHMMA